MKGFHIARNQVTDALYYLERGPCQLSLFIFLIFLGFYKLHLQAYYLRVHKLKLISIIHFNWK